VTKTTIRDSDIPKIDNPLRNGANITKYSEVISTHLRVISRDGLFVDIDYTYYFRVIIISKERQRSGYPSVTY
jgi:hypothetical protein